MLPYIAKSAWHPVVHLVRTGDVVLVVLALAGQTNSATTLDLFLPCSHPLETDHSTGPWWSDATAPRAGYAMTTMTMIIRAKSKEIIYLKKTSKWNGECVRNG